jgi:DNA-binding MurR/RpiR family transcriptional regulator
VNNENNRCCLFRKNVYIFFAFSRIICKFYLQIIPLSAKKIALFSNKCYISKKFHQNIFYKYYSICVKGEAMLLQEKMRQIKLAPSERTLIDYLLEHPTAMAEQTIKELSEETYVHPSTFIRISKKLGFNGWVDLKNAFIEEQTYINSHFTNVDANFPFSSQDGIMTIAKKLANLEQTTIEDTLSLIHHDQLQQAKQLLLNARVIKIFASNANTLISQDFVLKMRRINKNILVCNTVGENAYEATNCDSSTCVLLISYTGENRIILQTAEILAKNEVPMIGITSIGENKLSELADCVLNITTRERLYSKIANFTINTSICYLLDLLYAVVFSEHYEKNLHQLIEIGTEFDKRPTSSAIIAEPTYDKHLSYKDALFPN